VCDNSIGTYLGEGINAMDDGTSDYNDQTDEESLTYEVSDEALEAAAGSVGGAQFYPSFYNYHTVAICGC
jgi:hypothetical protein